MNQWTDRFPPLNLWNYNQNWDWLIDTEIESFFETKEINEQVIGHTQSSTR
jgi:hypothetical protein